MATSMINEDRFFRSGVKRLFTGRPWEVFNEILQNAQRSMATHVWITFPDAYTCVVRDDGHGLTWGLESLRTLLVFSDSGFANSQVEAQQRPLGMGFYSLIANERVRGVALESYTPTEGKVIIFAIDTERWLDDGEYRASWRERVEWREPENGETGFQLTITGNVSLMQEIRACLLDTPVQRVQSHTFGMSGHWIRTEMSPACGYGDLLEVLVDGGVLDTRLPAVISIRRPQIVDTYMGNPIRISLFEPPSEYNDRGYGALAINWWGQLILDSDSSYRQWHAYLHVRVGHPVTPKAPTRSGLVHDEALRSLYEWIEDRIFAWVCSQEAPPVQFVERLYAINPERAERECPFAVIQPWKPLPLDYVFDSHSEYAGCVEGERDEATGRDDQESDQLGPRQVIRKSDLGTVLILDERVTCPLPTSHPAQPWHVQRRLESGELRPDDIVLTSFDIGMNSLLRATGVEAYRAGVGVPQERVHTLWWRPGAPVDDYHTTSAGVWGIQFFPTPQNQLECIERIAWNPLAQEALPVFVVGAVEYYDIKSCCWIIALASTEAMVSFLQHCGHAAFEPDEDDEDESAESYERSVQELIRTYLRDAIARDITLCELAEVVNPFLPAGYDARYATFRLIYDETTKSLKELRLSFSFRMTEGILVRSRYRKVLRFY
jgi:hypothetical protein